MKCYKVKYSINQDVYILNDKSIYQTKIHKIRATEYPPIKLINCPQNSIDDAKEGITIEYLVVTRVEKVSPDSSNVFTSFEWINQRDVYSNKEELINQIK